LFCVLEAWRVVLELGRVVEVSVNARMSLWRVVLEFQWVVVADVNALPGLYWEISASEVFVSVQESCVFFSFRHVLCLETQLDKILAMPFVRS
jgi:hypothetical protein